MAKCAHMKGSVFETKVKYIVNEVELQDLVLRSLG